MIVRVHVQTAVLARSLEAKHEFHFGDEPIEELKSLDHFRSHYHRLRNILIQPGLTFRCDRLVFSSVGSEGLRTQS
jgi:hypothetical protein